jgi:hypothetical protein
VKKAALETTVPMKARRLGRRKVGITARTSSRWRFL